jgi:hypothetical protein
MDVAATHGDVLERPDVMLDGSNQQAHGQESDEEADRGKEHSSVRPVLDVLVEDEAEPGEMEQQQHDCRYRNDEYQQDPFACQMHTVLKHFLLFSQPIEATDRKLQIPRLPRISYYAAPPMTTCAGFRKESRMKFANAIKLDRNPGEVEGSAVPFWGAGKLLRKKGIPWSGVP